MEFFLVQLYLDEIKVINLQTLSSSSISTQLKFCEHYKLAGCHLVKKDFNSGLPKTIFDLKALSERQIQFSDSFTVLTDSLIVYTDEGNTTLLARNLMTDGVDTIYNSDSLIELGRFASTVIIDRTYFAIDDASLSLDTIFKLSADGLITFSSLLQGKYASFIEKGVSASTLTVYNIEDNELEYSVPINSDEVIGVSHILPDSNIIVRNDPRG